MSERKFIEVQVKKYNDDWYIGVVTRCDGIERGCGQVGSNCVTRAQPDWESTAEILYLWGLNDKWDNQPFFIPACDISALRRIVRDFNASTPEPSEDGWEVIS